MKITAALLVTLAFATAAPACAQNYPNRPLRFIIPFPPGGPTDILGRLAATQLSNALGVGVVPDNRGGAGGSLGAELCAKSAADGYTLCIMSVAQAIAPSIYRQLTFDPVKDFAHITMLATLPSILLVHPLFPAKNVKELITLAKARSGSLSYASSGNGSSSHMLMELLKLSAGVNFVHIPYKGTGPALIDQISGQVEVGFAAIVAAMPYAQTGKLRTLAVSTRERFPGLPNVATIDESGVKGFDGGSWVGVVAPAGTPRSVIDKTNQELSKAFQQRSMKEKILGLGGASIQSSAEEFTGFVRAETEKWAKVVKAANISAD